MSDYDTQHARNHGRPMDYTEQGSGAGLWIVLGLLAVVALVGVIMAGAGGTPTDGTAPAALDPNTIAPADSTAPATGTGAPN